jgi:hypothetical protein
MVSCVKLLPPALFVLIFIHTASATSIFQSNTRRTHYIGAERNVEFEVFHPESTFEVSFSLIVSCQPELCFFPHRHMVSMEWSPSRHIDDFLGLSPIPVMKRCPSWHPSWGFLKTTSRSFPSRRGRCRSMFSWRRSLCVGSSVFLDQDDKQKFVAEWGTLFKCGC